MFRSLTVATVAIFFTGPTMADGISYVRLSYDYTQFNIAGEQDFEDTAGRFEGDVEYALGQFLFAASIGNSDISLEDDDDIDLLNYGVSGAYALSPAILLGLGLTGADIEIEDTNGAFEDDVTGYEAFGQYVTADLGFAGVIRRFDADEENFVTSVYGEVSATPDVVLSAIVAVSSEDDDNGGRDGARYNLSASYDQGPVFARAFLRGDTDVEASTFGIRGDYEFLPRLFGTGSYITAFGDDAFEAYVVTIGGGYEIADGVRAEANFGLVDGDEIEDIDVDVTRFQIGLTYEFGDRKRLDRRLEQDIIDDRQAGDANILGRAPLN